MPLTPAYLRYLSKFQRDVINVDQFDHICSMIAKHTTESISSTFERCALRGETDAGVTIRLGSIVDSQPLVENAPADAKQVIRDQMFFYVIELIKDEFSKYTKVDIAISVDDKQAVDIKIDWS